MVQIAIWGIAFMLVVKGIDIFHQQRLAEASGSKGSPIVSVIGFLLALIFAGVLFSASSKQVEQMPAAPTFGNP